MSESNSRKFSKGEIDITGELDFTSATMRGHIIPDTNDTYDIGSAEYKVRDMYVSDNSLWVGDDVKIGASGGKKKNKKRKTGKTPKKIYDAMIGVGKLFATETDLKNKFKSDIHDPAPDPTLDPGHADFHPPIRKWLEFSALNGQGGFKRPNDIFDDDDDFDSEDGVDAVEGLQAALDAKATITYVDTKIAALIGTAASDMDTLGEISDALGDDALFGEHADAMELQSAASIVFIQNKLIASHP
jgi:hypothetical protein